jgi:hypothetical protein
MSNVQMFVYFIFVIIVSITAYQFLNMDTWKENQANTISSLFSGLNSSIVPIQPNDPQCDGILCNYYIYSAFNCCNSGSISDGYCSTSILKSLISTGVRLLDFQIFSLDDQPVVSTSTQTSYYIKESVNVCEFSTVMTTITNYAFSQSNCPNYSDPLFLHFRFFSTNPTMYQNLAVMLSKYDNLFLDPSYSFQNNGQSLLSQPILTLKGNIIIIVDATNSSFLDCADFCEYVNLTSNSTSIRLLEYNNVVNSPDLSELQSFNSSGNMTIVIPNIVSGSDISNPNSQVSREAGAQATCMMFNLEGSPELEEYNNFFVQSGFAFVKKETLSTQATIPDPPAQSSQVSFAPKTLTTPNYSLSL